MAWSKPTVNRITADISTLSIYLRSTKKFGKTTLFRDTVMAKYGDPSRGLLIGCGNETGYSMLDNLNTTQIESYRDAIDLAKWLIEEKGKEHNIEMIAFDTVDELMLLMDKQTIAVYKEESGKQVKSIKGAFGGFGAGAAYSANNLLKPYISGLKKAGFGVWAIAHTNFKTIKEKGGLDEDGYMQLTSNLDKAAESAFGDIFDIVLTGVIDRDIESKKEKGFNNTVKTKNYITDTVRKLYFRGTALIDAGGRFADGAVPEFMVFDKQNMGEEFIKVVEEGIEKSKTDFSPVEKKPEPVEKSKISLTDEPEDTVDELKEVGNELVAKCNELTKTIGKDKVLELVHEYTDGNNPRAIKELDKAKELLEKLNNIKGE